MLRISGRFPTLTKANIVQRCAVSTSSHQSAQASEGSASLKNPSNVPPPPPPPPSGGGGGWFGKLLGFTFVGAGTVIGYAWYDPKFKQQLEANVPYTKEGLDLLFSYIPDDYKTKHPKAIKGGPAVVVEDAKEPPSLIKKKAPALPAAATSSTEQPKTKDAAMNKADREKLEQEAAEKVKKAALEREAEEAAENSMLTSILEFTTTETNKAVTDAISAHQKAASATKSHSQTLKKAMDMTGEVTGKEGEWVEVTKALETRQDAVVEAQRKADEANDEIARLKTAITDGKENAMTKKNTSLITAEEALNRLTYDLKTAVAGLNKALSEARVMAEYRDLVKKGRQQFKKELEAVMPEVKIGDRWGGKLTEEELNSLIAHAHRRIEQLQKQLIEQQALEQVRIEQALDRQKEEDSKIADEQVKREQEKLRDEFRMEKLVWDAEARREFEKELRQQLARQAAAHSDHLAEVLKLQEAELSRKYQVWLEKKVLEERDELHKEVEGSMGRLRGIEKAVQARADKDIQGRNARQLWLACQSLQNTIDTGNLDATTPEQQVRPLAPELEVIKTAGNSHPFVTAIVAAMPEEAVTRGVWTEDALIERFDKVHTICRRVALIDETGATLFRYLLSYMQSLFVFASRPIKDDEEVDLSALSTFKILDNARYCVERGELEQAVRWMSQLSGEARVAAGDWLREALLTLEARQAAQALLAHAGAEGIGSIHV